MATPARKGVHWNTQGPDFDIGSPQSDTSSISIVSTSSLQYINSQLVAHGFVSQPGLCLDGISSSNLDTVVKCLLDMLSQRVKDMSRTEQLTTELRTLRYDHERMSSMQKTASDTVANLERELNTQKSRLASSTKSLQQSESAHKQTTAELQRTRTSLQQVRATHQAEFKKKEKEVERMTEKWQKIADAQTKLGSTASGMKLKTSSCNAAVVEGSAVGIYGKGKGFLETALDDAEKAREQLGKDNLGLKAITLQVANEIKRVLTEMKHDTTDDKTDSEEPELFTLTTLFPLVPPNFTLEALTDLLANLRRTLTDINALHDKSTTSSSSTQDTPLVPNAELERLQAVIRQLEADLQISREQVTSQAAETQSMFDRFAADHRLAMGRSKQRSGVNGDELSVDLITAPARDEERERLEMQKRELEEERVEFTEATIRLGKERAALEAERLKLDEERRSWQVQIMLADLPPTPETSGSSPSKHKTDLKSSKSNKAKSPKKSPGKTAVKVGANRKTTRVGVAKRRSSSYAIAASPNTSIRRESAYETEFIPTSNAPIPQTSTRTESLLPTTFVLPPPSPKASFPAKSSLVLSKPFTIEPSEPLPSDIPDDGAFDDAPEPEPASNPASSSPSSNNPIPQTPQPGGRRLPFPMAKPFAPHMTHAYSPAKPSPLSRILMLGNSPPSVPPQNGDDSSFEALMEQIGELGRESLESEMFPEIQHEHENGETMSLAQQLGVSDSPPESPVARPPRPDSPLREKKVEPNIAGSRPGAVKKSTGTKGRVLFPDAAAGAKTKSAVVSKARPPPTASSRNARLVESKVEREKENKGQEAKKAGATTNESLMVSDLTSTKPTNPPVKKMKLSVGTGRGTGVGPRRVPIGSSEAPPIGRGRR
ncbi:hypothetical protein D9758_008007 [Tetrapyrgos nigripes]|uniref:Afadin and alpha-actinin-binding-domain-containing protein n=1 Tax=Tetrapyrgos nigripes TaxID=182062 RepID=A0A8H5FW41_9AGAR|nr:hypothetical protein D9758_008007 [Tetrapyrgos nigripes]